MTVQKSGNMLTRPEILRLVNDYIGVSQGYLGDFSYKSHYEFYPYYCDLDINPNKVEGTTRERFIHILETSEPQIQAKILRGILNKYPVNSEVPFGSNASRTSNLHKVVLGWINRLENNLLSEVDLTYTSDTVARAIRDCHVLLKENSAISGVDRIHTALHGYIEAICDNHYIAYERNASLPALFSILRREHPAFQIAVTSKEVTSILRSLGAIIDSLNPVRNQASLAHPNRQLIDEPEAALIINAAQILLQYIDTKLNNYASLETSES